MFYLIESKLSNHFLIIILSREINLRKESITLRIILIAAITIILLIPLFMIQSLIDDRQTYRDEAVLEVSKGWAGNQNVSGPVLTVDYTKEIKDKDGKILTSNTRVNLLPETLNYTVEIFPEKRYRGIYEVILYRAKVKINGKFNTNELSKTIDNKKIDASYVSFNLSDLRGMQKESQLKWNDKDFNLSAGLRSQSVLKNGFSSAVPIELNNNDYSFAIDLMVNGLENIEFLPIGKTTNVNVKSSWNTPSFTGAFLPSERKISEAGFTASWAINSFNRPYPQQWNDEYYDVFNSAFGLNLIVPVDQYQMTMRSSKYGLMIIVLTFLSFFMIELFGKTAIHPIQYLLVGLALVIFYSLLLAISEYFSFDVSYIIASMSVILLISIYTTSIYKSFKIGSIILGALIVFYGFMYTILLLQDYSLLIGNIALFALLASVMMLTRKLNWFDVLKPKTN